MCEPLTIAAVGLSVAAAGASVATQISAAKKQTKAIIAAEKVREDEINKSAQADMNDRLREMRREQARVRVAAGEAGLSTESASVEALLLDSAMQAELANDRTLANRESRQKANDAEATSMLSQIQKPTLLGAGLQIANAGVSAYAGASGGKIKK